MIEEVVGRKKGKKQDVHSMDLSDAGEKYVGTSLGMARAWYKVLLMDIVIIR